MNKPFKFRYTSQLAGSFVLVVIVLSLVGIFAASHQQGWFEGNFILKAKFDPSTGALGLREGNDIMIVNTLAGRIGRVTPTTEGVMETEFVIKESFRPFVRSDSRAIVKKKFVAAGDSYVDIEPGKGPVVSDGDYIECMRDQEIMETAQAVLADFQTVVLPLVAEVQEMLEHLNVILADVEKGSGVAGSLVSDKELADDVKDVVKSTNLTMEETQKTFRETTRLVRGLQKTWFIRKHIDEDDKNTGIFSPLYLPDDQLCGLRGYSEKALEEARVRNDSSAIARQACQLGYMMLLEGKYNKVRPLLSEAMAELSANDLEAHYALLLKSEFLARAGDQDAALQILNDLEQNLSGSEKEVMLQCKLAAAALMCDMQNLDAAREELKSTSRLLKKIDSNAAFAKSANIMARILYAEKKFVKAARSFDDEGELRRSAGQFAAMSRALCWAAAAYEMAGDFESSADRYFRSGRSLLYYNQIEVAESVLLNAVEAARRVDDGYIINQASAMLSKIRD